MFSPQAGRDLIGRQWGRLETGEGVALALTDAATDEAVGPAVLPSRRSKRCSVGIAVERFEKVADEEDYRGCRNLGVSDVVLGSSDHDRTEQDLQLTDGDDAATR